MKKGCLLWLLQLAALVGLYYLAFRGRFTPPADLIGALAGGFFLLLAIGAFQNASRARKNRSRLDRALAGLPFEDGRQVAAIGPISALGAPLEAPFSGTPCVICSWEISHQGPSRSRGGESNAVHDFSGFHLTPCVVHSPAGPLRILGFPNLEGFEKTLRFGSQAFDRAAAYLRSTAFEKMGLTKVFSQVKDLLTDDDGYIRKDWRMAGEDFALDADRHVLSEQVVEDGETVCALGTYSAAKGGLVPAFGKGGEGLTLVRGGREAAEKRLKGHVGQNLATGVAVLLVTHFFLFMFLFLREPSVRAEQEELREAALLAAARNGDLAGLEAGLDAGTEADARDAESNTPLMMTRDQEVARRLITAGADVNARNRSGSTPLIEAARSGSAEVARLLIAAGADLEARDTSYHLTPLGWALQTGGEDVARLLRAGGAREPEETP